VPVHLDADNRERNDEWRDVFLRTFLLFWPIEESKTKLMLMLDEDQRNHTSLPNVTAELQRHPVLQTGNTRLVFNNVPGVYHNFFGWKRQQYIMFYADNFTSAEYVGFADTDCMFITHVDRSDLFVNDTKPVVNGKSGYPNQRGQKEEEIWGEIAEATYDVLGLKEPMKCMSFWPVIIQRKHLIQFREYLETRYQLPFYEIMRIHISKRWFGQFNMWCTYLFHYHRDDYAWFLHDITPGWNYEGAFRGQMNSSHLYTPEMYYPKPRIALHTRHHYPPIATNSEMFNRILFAGLCYSTAVYPELHAYCKDQILPVGANGTFLAYMFMFEKFRFFSVYPDGAVLQAVTLRNDHLKKCYGLRPAQHVISEYDIDNILIRHAVAREGDIITFASTGKWIFVFQNLSLHAFPNWDTYVQGGFNKLPAHNLDDGLKPLFVFGADVPSVR
jgi:hypothetical protein